MLSNTYKYSRSKHTPQELPMRNLNSQMVDTIGFGLILYVKASVRVR